MIQGIPEVKLFGSSIELIKGINNKFATRKLAEESGFKVTKGYFCTTIDELRKAYSSLRASGFEKCVLKILYGSSGKGLRIIDNENMFETLLKFIARRNKGFELLIEGWYPIRHNMNGQLWIDQSRVEILAITEQMIDHQAVYRGTCFTPNFSAEILEKYRGEMIRLGEILRDRGYYGVCGVVSIVDEEGNLFPVIEINARFTQVTYLLPLVIQRISQYPHIISSFLRFETARPNDFPVIYAKLQEVLRPDLTNGFLVYTFAKYTLPDQSKTLYRVFSLFFGNDHQKIQSMLDALREFEHE